MGKPKGESRGLEFLRKVRPQALEHLLSFFAESARHLDPKTRFLISLVTKVINGSERGVQQYARRALESGAGADELVDAVLCAYPCAGLTKVVDAIDTILDMKIEGLALEEGAERPKAAGASGSAPVKAAPAAAPSPAASIAASTRGTEDEPLPVEEEPASPGKEVEWVAAGEVSDIPPIGGRRVIARTRDIAVFSVEGNILAVENRCPHRGGSLCDGVVAEGIVTCPLHHWRYDLKSGQCPDRPKVSIATFPVRLEGNKIFIGI